MTNNSDYTKTRTNLNDNLPLAVKSKVMQTINDNLFNRYLTKSEHVHIDGIIGTPDNTSSIAQIKESTQFDQIHQLQPVAHEKIGTVDSYLSFNDFLNRLSRLGVDTTKFDEWGTSLQFNWVPPIDIDKLINYQDYYWDANNFGDAPQYVTVKNQCTWASSRLKQIQKSIVATSPTYAIFNIDIANNKITLNGNKVTNFSTGEILIGYDAGGNYTVYKIASITFNTASLKTDIIVLESVDPLTSTISKTLLPIQSIDVINNRLVLAGDLHLLFTDGYVFSTVGSLTSPTTYWEVLSSAYVPTTGTTVITVKNNITNTFDWDDISISPVVFLSQSEATTVCTNNTVDPISVWDDTRVGDLIWAKNYNIVDMQTHGFTILGSNIFNDTTVNFLTLGVAPTDILIANYNNGTTVSYIIDAVDTHALILTANIALFNRTAINYSIVRNKTFTSLISLVAPTSPTLNQYWVDSTNDTLNKWNGSNWIKLQSRISVLYNTINKRNMIDLMQTDAWSAQNNWIHRNEISNFTGKTRAQLPIIEYYPYLEFSQTSSTIKSWKYRKDPSSSYTQSTIQPTLFELLNISLASVLDPDFSFQTPSIILLNQKYGNLTTSLTNGKQVVLSGFTQNNGTYVVKSSEFIQMTPTSRFITRVYLTTEVPNPLDYPEGSNIAPKFTSYNDTFLGSVAGQWFFEGITNVSSSSINPIKNPMLDIVVSSFSDNTTKLDTLIGLVWEEFSLNMNSSVSGLQLILHDSLHDLALYNEYQEGDIRVYVNGIRQYGNFIELKSNINSNFVGGIKFENSITTLPDDVIRIELGEYASSDVGLRAVNVLTAAGNIVHNLTNIKKVEQQKTDITQYPEFNVYDVGGHPLPTSSIIFAYQESSSSAINLNVSRRIVYNANTKDYTFDQFLVGPDNQLLLYKDFTQVGEELQSIWKKGTNNEQYVPQRLASGEWELPNQWYYNVNHDNRQEISLSELFRHFNTIIAAQSTPSVFSTVGTSLYYLDDNINYGLGGTIKEHNNGMDLLMSTVFVNNVNPISLIEFAHNQYLSNISNIQEQFRSDAINLLAYNVNITNLNDLTNYISANIKSWFETNDKHDQWFGDSTTFNPQTETGVKNWIATIPYLGLGAKYSPYYISDPALKLVQLHHHDGHRSNISYSIAIKNQIYKQLSSVTNVGNQTVAMTTDSFPTTVNSNTVKNGDYLIRTDLQATTTSLYRYNLSGMWELVNIDIMLAKILLSFEQALFDNLPVEMKPLNFNPIYDVGANTTNPQYNNLIRHQFSNYIKNNDVTTPFSSTNIFKANNPFTWNYAYTPVSIHPVSGLAFTNVSAAWQALYTQIYGTPYPHREPWVLQGYIEKPLWWDRVYIDTTGTRHWKATMWNNIFAGIIPLGQFTPNGSFGTGKSNQISTLFKFVSVNVDPNPTRDGILPDGLLPPFWNTRNSTNTKVRSLYDPNLQHFITTPQADYIFGQNGPYEWEWNVSAQRLYDDLTVSFEIDPMKFVYLTFGINFINVNCLQVDKDIQRVFSHKDTVFHGDFIASTNTVYKSNGLNQWYIHYNRYNGFDDVNSGFKSLWQGWDIDLSYLFNSFIDTSNFIISSDIFDLSDKDYSVSIKKTQGISDMWLDALKGTVLNVPSKFIQNRDNSIEWSVQFNNTSPIGRNLLFYAPEDYNFRVIPKSVSPFSADTFRIYSYNIVDVGIENSYAYRIVSYNQGLSGIAHTNLTNDNFEYSFKISVNGGQLIPYSIKGKDAQTYDALVEQINIKLNGLATASIIDGNLRIKSNTFGNTSSINVVDNGLFVSASPTLYNSVSDQILSTITFLNYFILNGNKTNIFNVGDSIGVTNSTNFNGTYTVSNITFDIPNARTIITVREHITISSLIVDGVLEPLNAKTLPDTWKTGTQINLNTTGILPSSLDETTPYYVIIVNDREFRLSTSQIGALNGAAIAVNSIGSGDQFAGRVQTTFKALSGITSSASWRRHFSDKRYVESVSPPLVISGIQYMVDFLKGYEDYTMDLGFSPQDSDGENVDSETGRLNTWEFETEKFINELYNINITKTAQTQQYQITPVSSGNYFTLNQFTANWQLGTQVVLNAASSSQLPSEFNNPLISFVPYYVIPSLQKNQFQLALSLNDAKSGKAINFTDNGFGTMFATIYQKVNTLQIIELNPFKNYIWIQNNLGILSNTFAGSNVDILTNQRIYDNNGNELTVKELLVLRSDKQSRISVIGKQKDLNATPNTVQKYIQGMHLFFDGYEHILSFNNTTSDGYLVYDPFLGLNTPRFYLNFNRQNVITHRPNMGGFILQDNALITNFEASADNLRYAYRLYNDSQAPAITNIINQSVGYGGTVDYMDSLKINPQSQFRFWQGMIQQKGTTTAINAFINQNVFGNISVDEFWAYKLATFGDIKNKDYLELKLKAEDVENKELRLEFVLPDSTALDDTFQTITLTDMNRWWNQPDQYLKMSPVPSFYFDIKTMAVMKDINSKIVSIDGKDILQLPMFADGVIVTYYDPVSLTRKLLSENDDFTYLNSTAIIFSVSIFDLQDVQAYIVTYDYNSQNPARIIDKRSDLSIVNVPIWNPVQHQYYYNAIGIVDIKSSNDPAKYTTALDGTISNAFWSIPEVDTVWFDDSGEGYYPYYDKQIYPDINDRLSKWGILANWAKIALYEWTESKVPPSQWNAQVILDANDVTIPQQDKTTGQVRQLLYKNNGTLLSPIWQVQVDQHFDVVAAFAVNTPVTLTFSATTHNVVDIYVNGAFVESLDIGLAIDASNNLINYISNLPLQNYVHVVLPVHAPTIDELNNKLYAFDTPYSTVTRVDPDTTQPFNVYYFWVTKKTNKQLYSNQITIFEAEQLLTNMTAPYMIVTGFRGTDFGYGLTYGNVFDEDSWNVPARFTQVIARGLAGLVTDENRYTLQFTRDFTLRDQLPTGEMLNDVHVEWKLFREKQLSKIDSHLWDKLVAALVGTTIVNRAMTGIAIPSLNRILYDDLFGTDTKYGLGDDQIFTNSSLTLKTITAILQNPNIDFGNIDISSFLQQNLFTTNSNILTAMYVIYDNFPISTVNYIYFQTLYDAFSLKKQYIEFFKTSWVAIEVSQNVKTSTNIPLAAITLSENGPCFLGQNNGIIFSASVLNEYLLFVSSDGSVNYVTFNGEVLQTLRQEIPLRIFGAGAITGVWSDGVYVYISSANGGVDVYYFNGTNFITVSGLLTNGSTLAILGYNPVLIASYNGDGLGVYTFNGISFTELGISSDLGISNVNSITLHNNYIITCGHGRIDAWRVVNSTLIHINALSALIGGDDVTKIVSDGRYIYTGSNNNVKIQIFTFDGVGFNQVYSDASLTSGPAIAVGNGYFFTTGSDLYAYEFNGSILALIDTAKIGPTSSDISFSENAQRLYAADVGVFNFSNNKFEKLYDSPITTNHGTGSFILENILNLPQPSLTPTPSVTPSMTPTPSG